MKTCKSCELSLPEHRFGKRAASPDGLQTYCKSCQSEKAKASYVKKKDEKIREGVLPNPVGRPTTQGEASDCPPDMDPNEAKWCKDCDQWLPHDAFSKRAASKDGLQTYCKGCSKARQEVSGTNRMKEFERLYERFLSGPRGQFLLIQQEIYDRENYRSMVVCKGKADGRPYFDCYVDRPRAQDVMPCEFRGHPMIDYLDNPPGYLGCWGWGLAGHGSGRCRVCFGGRLIQPETVVDINTGLPDYEGGPNNEEIVRPFLMDEELDIVHDIFWDFEPSNFIEATPEAAFTATKFPWVRRLNYENCIDDWHRNWFENVFIPAERERRKRDDILQPWPYPGSGQCWVDEYGQEDPAREM